MNSKRYLLVEAVIVVLILSMLITVMLPKFMDAQVNVKIAESLQKQETVAQAVKTMYAERGAMLMDLWDDDTDMAHRILKEVHYGVGAHTEYSRWMSDITAPLTTPVAYLNTIPLDPWRLKERAKVWIWPGELFDNPGAESFLYIDWDPIVDRDNTHPGWSYGSIPFDGKIEVDEPGEFLLIGLSPYWHDEAGKLKKQKNPLPDKVQYDVSNGIYSRGEIMTLHQVTPKQTPDKYAGPYQRMTGGF